MADLARELLALLSQDGEPIGELRGLRFRQKWGDPYVLSFVSDDTWYIQSPYDTAEALHSELVAEGLELDLTASSTGGVLLGLLKERTRVAVASSTDGTWSVRTVHGAHVAPTLGEAVAPLLLVVLRREAADV